MRVGLHQRPWFLGLVTSLLLHAGGAAVVLSMPPVQARGLGGGLAEGRAEAPMMLVVEPARKPEPPPPPPEPPRPKREAPPEPPPPEPVVRIGSEKSTAKTSTWLESLLEGEHAAPLSQVEQPSLRKSVAEPPPAPPASPATPEVPAAESAAPAPAAASPQSPAPPALTPPAPTGARAEVPKPPDPSAVPSPVEVAPPPPPAASAPPPKPVAPEGAGLADPPAADRRRVEAPRTESPLTGEKVSEKPAGPDRDGPAESPTKEPVEARPRDEVGPADAVAQRPPPAPEPAIEALMAAPAPEPRAANRPASPARPATPPRPSGRGSEELDTQAWLSDREADASSPRRAAVYRNGRVEAGEGLDIKTVRPQFSRFALTFASPRSAVVEVFFDRQGVVKRVTVLRSTGYPQDIDEPIRNAVFNWRASGRLIRDLPDVPDAGVSVRIEFLLGG